MPSLIAFGRRWNIASDDFVFPEITEAFVRFLWIACALLIFFVHSPFDCKSPHLVVYLFIFFTLNAISLILCVFLALLSSRGTIIDGQARARVPLLIYIRLPIFIFEFTWTVASTVMILGHKDLCNFVYGFWITVILEWILMFSVLLGIIVVFNPHGKSERSLWGEQRSWTTCLKPCKFRQNDIMRAALDDIALLMATFSADNDFVLSDLVCGLLLYVHSPHRTPRTSVDNDSASDRTLAVRAAAADWQAGPETLNTVKRMLDFAVAVYGWPMYMMNNCGFTGWFRLFKRLQCFQSCSCNQVLVVQDNCCFCHTAAFVLESQVDQTDLFFVSFRNALYKVPFVVLVDHATKSIVITIRGSASLMDLVTDLSLNDELFTADVDSDPILRNDRELDSEGEVRVHRGMLNGARYVYETLREHNVIEDLYVLNPGYNLVICGHSLGGGVASLLTLLLKQTYPQVRCYAFSPPGCVISEHGVNDTESHVLGIVVGDDIVPRISYQSMLNLKQKIDQEIFATNKAKYEIIIKGIFQLFFSAPWELHNADEDAENVAEAIVARRRLVAGNGSSAGYGGTETGDNSGSLVGTRLESARNVRLYPPGRLLHLRVDEDGGIATRWMHYSEFSEIIVTGTMFSDHMPYAIKKVLRKTQEMVPAIVL
ncbi:hypothetical protein QR680_012358 [Steinernema hermaphroditum]|uniref:sn-1-specific diacylglycerol lipase n=1 Tax=Steinernema hermaphroditum TaxID=289476 RepID=A0AA39M0M0_9BILA|nr:hypothetical protein QR680_012358 [Steinernema hermaphroditum]